MKPAWPPSAPRYPGSGTEAVLHILAAKMHKNAENH
jgi:hypothetical protein